MARGWTGAAAPQRQFRRAHCLRDIFAIRSETEAGRAPIKKIYETLFGGLRYGIDVLSRRVLQSATRAAQENRDPRYRDEPLENARFFLRCPRSMQLRIGKEIVADTVGAIKIERRRARRHENNSTLRIEGHAGPIVGRSAGFPCVLRPSVVAKLTGARNGVK